MAYTFKGHSFLTKEEYDEAKKEWEAIEYLKSKTDVTRPEVALKLYDRMVDRKMVTTVVGIDFLKELRAAAVKDGFITEDKLKELPKVKAPLKKLPKKKPTETDILKRKNRNLKVVIFGLIVIIAGMFVIVLTGNSSPLKSVYEEQVLDKYSAWQEELTRKQEEINEKLYFLEKQGIYFEEENNTEGD